MKFVVKKRPFVEIEAVDAAVWYDERVPGLGSDFLDEVDSAVASLADNALLYSIRFANVRCIRLNRFKDYGVYYLVMGDEVWVLAILHGAREIEKLIQGRTPRRIFWDGWDGLGRVVGRFTIQNPQCLRPLGRWDG